MPGIVLFQSYRFLFYVLFGLFVGEGHHYFSAVLHCLSLYASKEAVLALWEECSDLCRLLTWGLLGKSALEFRECTHETMEYSLARISIVCMFKMFKIAAPFFYLAESIWLCIYVCLWNSVDNSLALCLLV